MSAWRPDQITRLQLEVNLLAHKWPGWQFADVPNLGAVFACMMRTNSGREYAVKILATHRFPDEQPMLYVVHPRPNVTPLAAHSTHTLGQDEHGIRICGYANWTPRDSILQAATRIREWLQAYEASQRTGRTIASILD